MAEPTHQAAAVRCLQGAAASKQPTISLSADLVASQNSEQFTTAELEQGDLVLLLPAATPACPILDEHPGSTGSNWAVGLMDGPSEKL